MTTRKSLLVYVLTRLLIIWVYIIYRSFWQYQFRQINKAEIFKEKFFHVNTRVIGSRSIVYSYWVSSLRPYKHQRTPLYWLRYQLLHFTDSGISYSTLLTQISPFQEHIGCFKIYIISLIRPSSCLIKTTLILRTSIGWKS